mgnify:CR=1 FL=1
MSIYKLIPALKDYIWGGTKLKEYRQSDLDKISEKSCSYDDSKDLIDMDIDLSDSEF